MKKLCLKRLDDSKEIKQSPYYIKKYLETLCALHLRDKSLDEPLFTTQTALVAPIAKKYPAMKSLNQSSVSRTFKNLLPCDWEDEYGNRYRIIRTKNGYFLKQRCEAHEMIPLYESPNIFVKDSVFKLTEQTLVFKVIQDKDRVDDFISLIESTFSEDLFWGISHQGSYLYLMFNKNYDQWISYRNAFFKYFSGRKDRLGKNTVDRQIKKAITEEKKRILYRQTAAFLLQKNLANGK